MSVISQLNGWPMYLICGTIILFVVLLSVIFLIRAYRAGLAIGMDRARLRRTITSSCTFTLLPSVGILLGVIALSGSLGVPLPWLRLSVIGALHYETSVADIAAKGCGLTSLNAEEMTLTAYTTIALVMSAGIIWSLVFTVLFNKSYSKRLQAGRKKPGKQGKKGFGDMAMTAMFIGLVAAYVGSYIGTWTSTADHNFMPFVVLVVAAAVMAVFTYYIEKRKAVWLENFSIAGSMLIAMAAAVGINALIEGVAK